MSHDRRLMDAERVRQGASRSFASPVCRPIRTRSSTGSGHGSVSSATCEAIAAATASPDRWNAAATPSPPVENTNPLCPSITARKTLSWRANASRIASGCSSHRRVEPSRSVNKKVTIPVGNSDI